MQMPNAVQTYPRTIGSDLYAEANPGYLRLHSRSGSAENPRQIVLRQKGAGQRPLWNPFLRMRIRQPESAAV